MRPAAAALALAAFRPGRDLLRIGISTAALVPTSLISDNIPALGTARGEIHPFANFAFQFRQRYFVAGLSAGGIKG